MVITKREVLKRIKGLDSDTQKKIVCAMVGHSRIVAGSFWYIYCARCEEQIGETLGGSFSRGQEVAVVGHDCGICRKAAKTFTWRDTLLAPDPFAKVAA